MTEKLDDTEQAMMAYAQRCADLEAERDAARDDANLFALKLVENILRSTKFMPLPTEAL